MKKVSLILKGFGSSLTQRQREHSNSQSIGYLRYQVSW